MIYPAVVVANKFIELGLQAGRPVDPMKVQKLVYLSHGWHLAFRNTPLIKECVEAWPYGPVVPELYSAFKRYRSQNITETAPVPPSFPKLDGDATALITQVWLKYGDRTAVQLSMITHEPGYAWDLARRASDSTHTSPQIGEWLIRDEFLRRRGRHLH